MPYKVNLDPVDEQRQERNGADINQSLGYYGLDNLQYPDGINIDPDKQHSVVFSINVREKSNLGEFYRSTNSLYEKSTYGERATAALETEDITRGGQAILNNAGKLGLLFGGLANVGKVRRGEILGAGVNTVGTGVFARGGAEIIKAIDSKFLTEGNSTYRLKGSIVLHIENSPSVRYGINYTDKDLGALTGLITQASAEAATGQISKGFGKEVASRIIADLIKLPSLVPGGGTLADIRELSTRQKINPFREVFFESVDYRSFNFKYRFYPKNNNESKEVFRIIKLFKLHMHPEVSEDKFFFTYPSEFEISYRYKGEKNTYLHKMGRCALVGMEVEYGGDQFATFEDGSPVEIGMSLSFRELEQITSQGVNYYGY